MKQSAAWPSWLVRVGFWLKNGEHHSEAFQVKASNAKAATAQAIVAMQRYLSRQRVRGRSQVESVTVTARKMDRPASF